MNKLIQSITRRPPATTPREYATRVTPARRPGFRTIRLLIRSVAVCSHTTQVTHQMGWTRRGGE